MQPVEIVEGKLSVLWRDDVDTDQIVPKQFLKRVEREGYGEYLFWDWFRSGEIKLPPGKVLLAGRNFGCGSSREHAVWALKDFGFEAIVAPSFSDIFHSNSAKNGLLLVELSAEECQQLLGAGEVRIDLPDQTVTSEFGVFDFDYDSDRKERMIQGLDDITETLQREESIQQWEKAHPLERPISSIIRRLS